MTIPSSILTARDGRTRRALATPLRAPRDDFANNLDLAI
jgi:hypothetical protein